MGFKSLFKPKIPKSFSSNSNSLLLSTPSPWPWPSCKQPRTHSFHLLATSEANETLENLDYIDSSDHSCFTDSSFVESECSIEAVMEAMSSKRLIFDGSKRSKEVGVVAFEGVVAVEMESQDLYKDFRASMKEVVEANGEGKGLVWFEEMLEWYLRINKRWAHKFIIGAYVDLLLEMMAFSTCRSSSCCGSSSVASLSLSLSSSSSSSSTCSCSYFSCLSEIEMRGIVEEGEEGGNS